MQTLSRLPASIALAASLVLASPAAAEVRALLVGVSDYDDSLEIADLDGPPNDIRLLDATLRGRGVAEIEVLADGVPGAGTPTRAAILAALDRLAGTARAGDLVYLHFSGHGTQQIDTGGDETDGLDEVFLPRDAARGAPGSGQIANALSDDEIGTALASIRATGADVWLVMDSCHSGSGMRAIGDGAVARFVDPSVFGIDTAAGPEPHGTPPVEAAGASDLPGGIIAFYAAQSDERAYEVALAGTGGDVAYGRFSAALAARLGDGTNLSYRQLFQAVMSDMAEAPGAAAAQSQTPLWEGTLGDAVVLGGSGTVGLRQFRVEGGTVQAGRVHGFAEGTLMALVPDAAAAEGTATGYAQLEEIGPTAARLRYVAEDCQPQAAALCPAVAAPADEVRFARPLAAPADLVLRLSPVQDLRAAGAGPVPPALPEALAQAIATLNAAGQYRVESDAAAPDIAVGYGDGALWFGRPALIGETPAGLRWTPDDAPLEDILTRIVRAERLAAALASADPGASLLNRNPVEIAVSARRVDPRDLEPAASGLSIFEECGAALTADGVAVAPLAPTERLKPCDQILVSAQGTRDAAYDINRIKIDAQYCVSAVHERIEGRAPASGRLTEDITLCNARCPAGPESAGAERLFVVVSTAEAGREPLNLTGLVDTCGEATRNAAPGGAAAAFLADVSAGRGTRSAMGLGAPKTVWVESFNWWNMPRAEVAREANLLSESQ